jgi:hypothetical protein
MRANVYLIDDNTYGFNRTCFHCEEESSFRISYEEYKRLFINEEYIQDVYPNMPKEDREFMISGTHSHCWNEMFADLDEDAEEDE